MGCGCGGAKIPNSVGLRMECLRLALGAVGQIKARKPLDAACAGANVHVFARQLYDFALGELTAADLDTAPASVPKGADPDAVIARNALINAPLRDIAALPADLARKYERLGIPSLGAVVQTTMAKDAAHAPEVRRALAAYGLRLGMTQDDLREWVLRGPQA